MRQGAGKAANSGLPRGTSSTSNLSHASHPAGAPATSEAVWLTRSRAATLTSGGQTPGGSGEERGDSKEMDAAPLVVRGVLDASYWSEDGRGARLARLAVLDQADPTPETMHPTP